MILELFIRFSFVYICENLWLKIFPFREISCLFVAKNKGKL